MLDPKQIASLWNESEEKRFEFACFCADVVGKRDGMTELIASAIKRSVDVVENYARAGRLWLVLIDDDPIQAENMREDLPISFWLPLARLYESDMIRIDGVWHWMTEAVENKWTVEKLRSMLPTRKPKDSDLEQYISNLEKLVNAPQFGADNRIWQVVNRLLRKAIELLKASGGTSPSNGEN